MYTTQQNNTAAGNLKLFGNVRVLITAALFVAMSSVLGKLLAIDIGGVIRISFENLPILMAGIWFGPFVGAAVGAGADIFGCILKGFPINPIITLGFAGIGFIAGIVSMHAFKKNLPLNLAVSVFLAHIICSMIIKSIGLHVYYGYTLDVLIWRVPLYIGIAAVEYFIIYMLTSNKAFSEQLDRMCNNVRLR